VGDAGKTLFGLNVFTANKALVVRESLSQES
ncbi:hypothetical protein ACUXQ2_006474, partial [Cupriavidus metallidurans]